MKLTFVVQRKSWIFWRNFALYNKLSDALDILRWMRTHSSSGAKWRLHILEK